MDSLSTGSCAQYSPNEPEAYFNSIKFWKTPVADCGNGQERTAWTYSGLDAQPGRQVKG